MQAIDVVLSRRLTARSWKLFRRYTLSLPIQLEFIYEI